MELSLDREEMGTNRRVQEVEVEATPNEFIALREMKIGEISNRVARKKPPVWVAFPLLHARRGGSITDAIRRLHSLTPNRGHPAQ